MPRDRLINNIINPMPKFFGNEVSVSNKYLRTMPPLNAPRLLKANPIPKNFPLSDLLVVYSKKSAQMRTIIPIDKA